MVLLDALRHDGGAAGDPWGECVGMHGSPVTGSVEEVFGFQTRPAYFAGLTPEQSGLVTMMIRSPATSPFRALRHVPDSLLRTIDRIPAARSIVRQVLTARLRRRTDAVGLYGTTLDVPLDLLPAFDFAEKTLPWEPYGEHPTIFSLVAARGEKFLYCGYPFVTNYGSDEETVADFCRRLTPDCRFAFLQLNELDGVGHRYGPEGGEYAAAVQQYQQHLGAVVDRCRALFGESFHLIAFGDHGMVPVHSAVDGNALRAALPGRTSCFIDSTLLRVWCADVAAEESVRNILGGTRGGRILDAEAAERYQVRVPDAGLGHVVFLADPGVVFHPSFFAAGPVHVKGMHGYDPSVPANRGALLILSPRAQAGDAGVVHQTALFHTALDLLGLGVDDLATSVVGTRSGSGS